jgi:hypothetical protein
MIYTINPGVDTSFSTKLNNNFATAYKLSLLNTIRQAKDRTINLSTGYQDPFVEAYTDTTGSMGSVTLPSQDIGYDTSTLSIFSNNIDTDILAISTAATYSNNTVNVTITNEPNAYDSNDSTYCTYFDTDNDASLYAGALGRTFTSRNIYAVKYVFQYVHTDLASSPGTYYVKIQSYNGSTWSDVATVATITGSDVAYDSGKVSGLYRGTITSCQGIRLYFDYQGQDNGDDFNFYLFSLEAAMAANIVEAELAHTIPSGTFPSNISSFYGVALIKDYEAGCDIQMKLTNSGNDSGYFSILDSNIIAEFTAFTSEPTTCYVKLIPKAVGSTGKNPSIYGIGVYAK